MAWVENAYVIDQTIGITSIENLPPKATRDAWGILPIPLFHTKHTSLSKGFVAITKWERASGAIHVKTDDSRPRGFE